MDWIQRPIEARAPVFAGGRGYFSAIRWVDDAANVSTDRLSTDMVESAIVAKAMAAAAAVIG